MTQIYGIKNCDTMKKAFKWLDQKGVEYIFHDYKKEGADTDLLKKAIAQHGWETVINRRGTTWRQLPDSVKENMDETNAVTYATDNPSLIKRPLLVHEGQTYLGFKDESYAAIFAA